mgnify:CR=1 FL=1
MPLYGLVSSLGESAEVIISPEGLRKVLNRVHKDYGVSETIITENGFNKSDDAVVNGAVDDEPRIEFLRNHVSAVHDAISDGCNVKGFCAWTFMDNFEWSHGFNMRFGLVHVDYSTQKRTLKNSAKWYSACAKANACL